MTATQREYFREMDRAEKLHSPAGRAASPARRARRIDRTVTEMPSPEIVPAEMAPERAEFPQAAYVRVIGDATIAPPPDVHDRLRRMQRGLRFRQFIHRIFAFLGEPWPTSRMS